MKLDNLVTTYEQSKRIKELGFRRGTPGIKMFAHNTRSDGDTEIRFEGENSLGHEDFGVTLVDSVRAYMAEELGEILPESIEVFKEGKLYQYWLKVQKSSDRREVYYYDDTRLEYLLVYTPDRSDKNEGFILGPTIAQAMGDMLIYLLENNLLLTNETDNTN